MATLYSNNFESYAHVATVPDFTALGGTSAYIVIDEGSFPAMQAAQGAKSYCAPDANDRNYWNGGSAIGDQTMSAESVFVSGHCVGHCLRVDISVGDRCYHFYYEVSAGNLRGTIQERDNGVITGASSSYNIAATAGDVIGMESSAIGSALELRVWNITTGGSRPSTATVTLTNSSLATGRQGLRKVGTNGTYASADSLVITDGASGGGELPALTLPPMMAGGWSRR